LLDLGLHASLIPGTMALRDDVTADQLTLAEQDNAIL
jgi:hypothetical protein